MTNPTGDFFALRDEIRGRLSGIDPADGAPDRLRERFVQAIWNQQLIRAEGLRTASGNPLEIHSPGRWNHAAGPDFLAAEISIGGKRLKGDIEVHTESRDWDRHGHTRDFAYNNCVLHVCLRIDDDKTADELHNGQPLQRFELEPNLFPDLETIQQSMQAEDVFRETAPGLGRCHEYCVGEDETWIRRFLDAGGRERMSAKIRRLADQRRGESFSQLFYQALMTAQGVQANKALFFLLAKRAPIDELLLHAADCEGHERVERIQAVLLHVAGLTPRRDDAGQHLDGETMDYLNRLHRHWSELSGYFADRIIPPSKRWHPNIRPVNFPSRRLAGIAHFAAEQANGRERDIFTPFVRRLRAAMPSGADKGMRAAPKAMASFLKQVEGNLTVGAPQDYWSRRYTFQAQPAKAPMTLIGDSRARSIVFNSLIPLLILHAREQADRGLEDFCWHWFENFPTLDPNNVTRFMTYRLFGENPRATDLMTHERMRQGLFQVFQSCCNNRERDCSECYFFRAGTK